MSLEIRLGNDLRHLQELAKQVERFGQMHGLDAETVQALNLSLDELVSNTIHHGFKDVPQPAIEIRLEYQEGWVHILLRDNGVRFNPFNHPAPDLSLPLAERSIGGLGIHFVRQLMDEISYSWQDGWNCIILRRKPRSSQIV